MMTTLAKEQAKLLAADKQQKAKEQREKARRAAKERATTFRQKDAHKKILLGGLIIAAEADSWNESEIVGALLLMSRQFERNPESKVMANELGVKCMFDRAQKRPQ